MISFSFAIRSLKKFYFKSNFFFKAVSKFDAALTQNATLREEIETLRIEKGKFQQIFKKTEKVN